MFQIRTVTIDSIAEFRLRQMLSRIYRFNRFWCCLLVCAGLLSECGYRGSHPDALTLVGFGLQAGEQLRRDALDEFTRSTGIRVDLVPGWGTSAEQLNQTSNLLRLSENGPDVYLIDIVWPGTLAADLLDLKPFVDSRVQEHLPVLLDNDTVQGRLVSLPLNVNVGMLYYRTDLLKKYGYNKPPDTWDKLETMAARIQRGERAGGNQDFWGYVWQGGSYEGLTCNALEWQEAFGGGRIIESNGDISVNNPMAREAFRNAKTWVGTISPKGVLSYTESDSLAVFRAGNAAFLRHWSGALSASRLGDTPIRNRFDVTLLPAGPKGHAQAVGGFHLAVGRRSAHPRESVQLLLFLTSRHIELQRAISAGYLPTIPRLYEEPAVLKVLPVAAALRNTRGPEWTVRPSTIAGSNYAAVSKAYYQAVHEILATPVDSAEVLTRLEETLVNLTGLRTGQPRN